MCSITIRGMIVSLAVGTCFFGLPKRSTAQNQPPAAPQATSQAAPNFASQPLPQVESAPADDSAQANQPMSLGDLARMVRAKKQTAPKATRVIDDENIPRNGGGISVVGNGGGAGGSSGGSKMTLLDFWASWCGPCRQSVPDLKALQRAYGSDQLEVVSVDEDKNENAGRSFASDNGMSWDVQYDPTGETSKQYDVHALPTFILVDSSGKEVQRFVGEDPSVPLAGRIAPFMPKIENASL
ncbi:MAG TPA: TlpA disulfide reductase family protein [Candidatus Acidoferrales bacterium]|nr:TlpA disulfide reductase family protein [Candidatus Acidoferrales bacterium]